MACVNANTGSFEWINKNVLEMAHLYFCDNKGFIFFMYYSTFLHILQRASWPFESISSSQFPMFNYLCDAHISVPNSRHFYRRNRTTSRSAAWIVYRKRMDCKLALPLLFSSRSEASEFAMDNTSPPQPHINNGEYRVLGDDPSAAVNSVNAIYHWPRTLNICSVVTYVFACV
ncbi:hypothetical protein EGR_07931 [Echinococcus granulosus]|uniref:Uncharacterized protein n=1 Tax=Echinococcus granulosus TaxID=6210 RepID=W6UGB0_ECHGR|nr:hypothetical protein EGR_07931 [Echinococcus granulosus]EUB57182.1 hypothetical protein EGR_07931 [Echinococcus granulosus]